MIPLAYPCGASRYVKGMIKIWEWLKNEMSALNLLCNVTQKNTLTCICLQGVLPTRRGPWIANLQQSGVFFVNQLIFPLFIRILYRKWDYNEGWKESGVGMWDLTKPIVKFLFNPTLTAPTIHQRNHEKWNEKRHLCQVPF